MKKAFVLDSNVLLHDPTAMFHFGDNHVVIPITVIEEIDRFKKEVSDVGRSAREVSRHLDALRERGKLSSGVDLDSGGKLWVALAREDYGLSLPEDLPQHKADNRILSVALALRGGTLLDNLKPEEKSQKVVFVTKDTNLRIKADALGLEVMDFLTDRVDMDELYTGYRELFVDASVVDRIYQDGEISLLPDEEIYPNECLLLRDKEAPTHTALARFREQGAINCYLIQQPRESIWGVRSRNKEQTFAMDLLLDDNIPLVTLVGKAGTGKTMLALAAGLFKTTDQRRYQRLLVSRPIFPLGRDLGFLPGDIDDKLSPWMKPIFDNLEFLLSTSGGESGGTGRHHRSYQDLIDLGMLELEPLSYIRGRSIPNQFMIIDEAQNLSPHEVKTIVTRAGHQTKLVFTGDPYQIDNPYVDSASNGLSWLVERFRAQSLGGHVTLYKGERSELAELAANIL